MSKVTRPVRGHGRNQLGSGVPDPILHATGKGSEQDYVCPSVTRCSAHWSVWAQWVSSGSGPCGQLLGQFPQPIVQTPCLARPQHFSFFSLTLPSPPASLSSNSKAHKAAFLVGPPEELLEFLHGVPASRPLHVLLPLSVLKTFHTQEGRDCICLAHGIPSTWHIVGAQ